MILVSFITGRDWRPYFNVRGIPFSDLANQQVEMHVNSSRVNATTAADFPFVSFDVHIPQANMTDAPLVPIDGQSAWPLDGFSVKSCSNVVAPTASPTPVSPHKLHMRP